MYFEIKKNEKSFLEKSMPKYNFILNNAEVVSSGRRKRGHSLFSYLFVAALFFTVFFVISNFSAFRQILTYYFENHELKTNVLELITEKKIQKELPLKVLSEEKSIQKIKVNLNFDITPPDNRLIIASLGLSVPIKDIDVSFSDNIDIPLDDLIEKGLQNGVVLYPGTAEPGKKGNTFITGHSSYYLWDPGKYKDVFALLPSTKLGDRIDIFYKQKKYSYKVTKIREVWPKDVDVLNQTNDYRLTLMTCTPVGTNLRRLIVTAQLMD